MSRIVHDQIVGWLEDALRPKLGALHQEFLWQYLLIFDKWTRFHTQSPGIDDQKSLAHLAELAEAALRDIASQYPVRLWLHTIRSIPLQVFAHISLPSSPQHLMEIVKIATSATSRHGKGSPSIFEDEDSNGLLVEPEWLEEFKTKLPIDVPRFIGAAHTWYYARGWYRIAGKGGVMQQPDLVDLNAARKSLDRLAPGNIMIVPSVDFQNRDNIMPQLLEYDRRTAEAASASITGVLANRKSASKPSDLMSWWGVRVSSNPLKPVQVKISYPLQNKTLITTSYLLFPDELTPHLDQLAPFAALMPERLGMNFESFGLCCRAVAATVRHQTGMLELRPLPDQGGDTMLFRSECESIERETNAASFLFSVMQCGLLRAPRRSWMNALTRLVTEGGAATPELDVQIFIKLFTNVKELDTDLQPNLFLETDPGTLALDLLSMNEFFNFCLRRVTAIDDAPTKEARRGAQFEQAVWDFFRRNLNAEPLVDINARLVFGNVQGEIDVAFRVGDVDVVLECKSWQKRYDYFRGDRKAIERRHEQLQQTVEKQIPRNVDLLRKHLGKRVSSDMLAFVCVAGPEFIQQSYPSLWYGPSQRVQTTNELLSLISDGPLWRRTIEASRSTSATGKGA